MPDPAAPAPRLAHMRSGEGRLQLDTVAPAARSAARARAQAPRGSRRRLRALGLAVLGALVVSLVVSQAAQAYVYWANLDTHTIARANLDGSGVNQRFITSASAPEGVAVDAAHVYWANSDGRDPTGADTIARSNLDGSGVNQRFITGASVPEGVAVDAAHVYWANYSTNTIARSNLDGSGANQSFITGASVPIGVAVDAAHVYWANPDIPGTIGRANLNGSGANQRFITGANDPLGVAVDAAHVYWANFDTSTIGRSNLDGSGADQSFITGTKGPGMVAVDALLVSEPRISIAGVASSRCRRANVRARVSVSDALKLKRVDVVLDGRRIVHTHAKRIVARVLARRLRAGSHTLKIIATDAAGKTTVRVVHFTRCG